MRINQDDIWDEVLKPLYEPYDEADIKQREQGGMTVDYVEAYTVKHRLNMAWGSKRQWKDVQREFVRNESGLIVQVIVDGNLYTPAGTVHHGSGGVDVKHTRNFTWICNACGSTIKRKKWSEKPPKCYECDKSDADFKGLVLDYLDLGNDVKSAESDAFKVAASGFGDHLELYSDENRAERKGGNKQATVKDPPKKKAPPKKAAPPPKPPKKSGTTKDALSAFYDRNKKDAAEIVTGGVE